MTKHKKPCHYGRCEDCCGLWTLVLNLQYALENEEDEKLKAEYRTFLKQVEYFRDKMIDEWGQGR